MHILYLHQYFTTYAGFTGTRSYEFAKRLASRGHRVTMLTSGLHSEDALSLAPGVSHKRTEIEGITVVPIAAGYNSVQMGTGLVGADRFAAFLQFAALATSVGKQLPQPDLVFATHTPLTIGLSGIALASHFDVPFVFEVRDLWPDSLVNIGAIRHPLVISALRVLEHGIYRSANHIIALSPGMKAGVTRTGYPADRVTVIPNGSDLDLFQPALDGATARARLGLGDRFAAIYFGAMGLANGLEYAVDAAEILQARGQDQVAIVLHGDGGRRRFLEDRVRSKGLRNVIFSNPIPDKRGVAELVAGCNVCMTIYANTDKEQTWSPNKMFDALAAGRPVLINVGEWLGDTIEDNECGFYVDPHRPAALADRLVELSTAADRCAELGRNARALAERTFARDILTSKLERVFERVREERTL